MAKIHSRINQLDSFKKLRRLYGGGRMRQIKQFIAVRRRGRIYLANTYFIKNVAIIYNKKDFKILKIFTSPLSFSQFVDKLQRLILIDFTKPETAEVEKINAVFKMVLLLMRQKFVVPVDFDESSRLKKYRALAFTQKHSSKAIYIIPSASCNLRCPDCAIYEGKTVNTKPAMMTTETFDRQWARILPLLPKKPGSFITVCYFGGEPLLNKQAVLHSARKILSAERSGRLGRARVSFRMVTNGTLIDEPTARAFKRYNMYVAVSLDGARERNDAQRIYKNGRGTFNAIMRGVAILEAAGMPYIFSCTIGLRNIDSMPADLKWLAENVNNLKIYFNIMLGSRHRPSPFAGTTTASFFKKLHKVFDTLRALGLRDGKMGAFTAWAQRGSCPTWFQCSAVTGGIFTLIPDGKIGNCPDEFFSKDNYFHYSEIVGDLACHGTYRRWRGRTPLVIPECYNRCEYFTYCSGGCPLRAEQIAGNIDAITEEGCLIQKFYIERAIIEICEGFAAPTA